MIYTVQQLIDALKELPPHAAINVWQDGDRQMIETVDHWDDNQVDLNLHSPKQENQTDDGLRKTMGG